MHLSRLSKQLTAVFEHSDFILTFINGALDESVSRLQKQNEFGFELQTTDGVHELTLDFSTSAPAKVAILNLFNSAVSSAPSRTLRCNYLVRSRASVDIIEYHMSLDAKANGICVANSRLELAESSRASYAQVVAMGAQGECASEVQAELQKGSRLQFFNLNQNSKSIKNQNNINLNEQAAEVEYYGLSFVSGKSRVLSESFIQHVRGNTKSEQIVRNIVDQSAQVNFVGRLKIEEGAQKSDANQQNSNLLLSDLAEVKARPQLEVFADDVKATHGATVGQINEDEIFYLQSRAIPAHTAKAMIAQGFQKDLAAKMSSVFLNQALMQQIEHEAQNEPS